MAKRRFPTDRWGTKVTEWVIGIQFTKVKVGGTLDDRCRESSDFRYILNDCRTVDRSTCTITASVYRVSRIVILSWQISLYDYSKCVSCIPYRHTKSEQYSRFPSNVWVSGSFIFGLSFKAMEFIRQNLRPENNFWRLIILWRVVRLESCTNLT